MQSLWLPLLLATIPHAEPFPSAKNPEVQIGNFSLRDHLGHSHQLSEWKQHKVLVVVFLGAECPLARLYAPRLAEMSQTYANRGVAFVGIHANPNESAADLARLVADHHIPFPVLRDMGNTLVDRFGATRTPEVFVLDAKRVIRYRGRIDDQYEVGLQRPGISHQDLQEALEELLAGKAISQPLTKAVGCLIGRTKSKGPGKITYHQDIAPILRQHCQQCHRPGQIGPFALGTYQEVSSWAAMIGEVVQQGRMPPWGTHAEHGRFANDPSLTDQEKKLLLAWIDADCPEGDSGTTASPPLFTNGWVIPQPDRVITMPRAFTVPAQGIIEYQIFVVDPGFKEDVWVQAAEIRPGNRAVVHHCNVFLQAPGSKELTEQGSLGSIALAAMAAGTPPMILPEGMAKRIPAGWRLVFVMHYAAIGTEQTDITSLGLKFADPKTVRQEVATKLMLDPDLAIPPHEPNYEVSHTWQINQDLLLLSFFPHMHLRGKSFRYEAFYPDGKAEVLLHVPHYDFNWQHSYVLAQPQRLPAGTRLRCTAIYDNSPNNPANPDPSATVRTGPQSWDEMFNGYFDVVLADQDLTRPEPWTRRLVTVFQSVYSPGISLLLVVAGGFFLTRHRIGRLLVQNSG